MGRNIGKFPALPMGEQPVVERVLAGPVVADTFAGRIHVEWDNSAAVTPLGQMPFFIEFVKRGGLGMQQARSSGARPSFMGSNRRRMPPWAVQG